MKTRSVLVYFPGYPFTIQALLPSRTAASVAGCLLEQGHDTMILDFGTVQWVDRLVHGRPAAIAGRVVEQWNDGAAVNPIHALHLTWQANTAHRLFLARRAAVAREVATRVASHKGLHFAAFLIDTVEDAHAAALTIAPLRELRPRLKLFAFGDFACRFPQEIIEYAGLDGVCGGTPEGTLSALAERVESPHLWHNIPQFVGRSSQPTNRLEDDMPLSGLPTPTYAPDAYPALKTEHKIRLFEVHDCRPSRANGYNAPAAGPIRMSPVANVCNEIWRVGTLFGARAFHFTGEAAPASHVSAIAHELLRRGMSIVYTRRLDVAQAVPAIFPALHASGCVALSFPVDTGSQRLMDSFYGRGITVSQTEHVLRCAKSVGITTLVSLQYPCPADDYHTRAESLRLIERTRPEAVSINVPRLEPGSRWFDSPAAFGFDLDRKRVFARELRSGRRYPQVDDIGTRLVYGAQGLSDHEMLRARRELLSEIEKLGVMASLPEAVVRVARVLAAGGDERKYANRVQYYLLRGDTLGMASMVDAFNDVACVPAKRLALRGPELERLAVGN